MSLINKMLQELDARRPEGGAAPVHNAQVRAVPVPRRGRLAWGGVAVAAGVVGLAAAAWFWKERAAHVAVVPPLPKQEVTPKQDAQPQQESLPAEVSHPLRDLPLKLDLTLEPQAKPSFPMEAKPTVPVAPKETLTTSPSTPKAQVSDAAEREPAKSKSIAPAAPTAARADKDAVSDIPVKELTPSQMAENEYRKALTLIQQVRRSDAIAGLERALQLDHRHAASRHALVGVLIDAKRTDDAMRQAAEGLAVDPAQTGMAMILARLQADKGETKMAIETLEHSLRFASGRPEYYALLAALLQRDQRHKSAAEHFATALKGNPQNGAWWMGLGISLQADGRAAEAIDAYKRAKATNTLSNELFAFVEGRLGQLQPR
ncbi:tetratricopeptide repeat protein [Noviherbaspirillum sp. ST9]|uniref:tetratricopeptide repeat protein n=1 Tax=Noviherbaspirillum sp. ST9 TaxID=3401606 RepID=UPI003B587A54